ncbi:MAG: (2Fe-2S)-binding protein [Planctomycetota bacterium]
MDDDGLVCLCFRVSQRKLVNFCRRERPRVASQMSECLGAGTGCGWCVPFLKELHRQVEAGDAEPGLTVEPEVYAERRAAYRRTGERG